jgi:hypothetical protein
MSAIVCAAEGNATSQRLGPFGFRQETRAERKHRYAAEHSQRTEKRRKNDASIEKRHTQKREKREPRKPEQAIDEHRTKRLRHRHAARCEQ